MNTVKTAEELGRPSANATYAASGFDSGEGGAAQIANELNKQIPRFAEGGIVNEATLGVFGEAGPEAIVPLNERNIPEGDGREEEELRQLRQEVAELRKTIAESDAYTQQLLKAMIERNEDRTDREIDAIEKASKKKAANTTRN
jgi:hypothetical protein